MLFTPFPVTAPAYYQDVAFNRTADTLYLTQIDGAAHRIVVSHMRSGSWSAPVAVSFSGAWRDLEEVLSPDGRTMIFASNRPASANGKRLDAFFGSKYRPGRGGNLWSAEWNGTSWGEPVRLPNAVNANSSTFSPALAADGTLYFMRASGANQRFHIFTSALARGEYAASALAPFSDLRYSDFDPTVSSDGSFVIFGSSRPPSKPGTADLFITYHDARGWTPPRDMGAWINPNRDSIEPRLSADDRTLYFTRSGAPTPMQRIDMTPWLRLTAPKPFASSALNDVDSTPTFSADGKTLVYAQAGTTNDTIVESHFDRNAWSNPVKAAFSGRWNDLDPVFSPDGTYAIFSSTRPVNGRQGAKPQLWRVGYRKGQWSEPIALPAAINDGAFLVSPSVASDGTLYYLHIANHVHRIYRAVMKGGRYLQPEPVILGDASAQDYDPWIAPDQSYLIFASSGRDAPDHKRHLYAVARHGTSWGPVFAIRYSGESASDDSGPVLSRDGTALYFISDRVGRSQVWILPLRAFLSELPV
jgi:Tol biopolymer transport system component